MLTTMRISTQKTYIPYNQPKLKKFIGLRCWNHEAEQGIYEVYDDEGTPIGIEFGKVIRPDVSKETLEAYFKVRALFEQEALKADRGV